jgi:hypothetical protein
MSGRNGPQIGLDLVDLVVEGVDQGQRRRDVIGPRLRKL